MDNPKPVVVLVEVEGGVAYPTVAQGKATVLLVDWDVLKEGVSKRLVAEAQRRLEKIMPPGGDRLRVLAALKRVPFTGEQTAFCVSNGSD